MLIISGLTGILSARLGRLSEGEAVESAGRLRIFGLLILTLAAVVVLLAVVKPG